MDEQLKAEEIGDLVDVFLMDIDNNGYKSARENAIKVGLELLATEYGRGYAKGVVEAASNYATIDNPDSTSYTERFAQRLKGAYDRGKVIGAIEALEDIEEHASGGGSWRRVITLRLAKLQELKSKGEVKSE